MSAKVGNQPDDVRPVNGKGTTLVKWGQIGKRQGYYLGFHCEFDDSSELGKCTGEGPSESLIMDLFAFACTLD